MANQFRGRIKRTYVLKRQRALLLEDGYEGDVEPGDWMEIRLTSGGSLAVRVANLAWGSTFQGAANPPLTLLVDDTDEHDGIDGAELQSTAAPSVNG